MYNLEDSIKEAKSAAEESEKLTGCPSKLSLAQWALESGWGKHSPGNNCFGIKEYTGCYGVQELMTTEVYSGVTRHLPQKFATFKNLSDCFVKHAKLITESKYYSKAWMGYKLDKNITKLVEGIAPVYSTSPTYSKDILSLISSTKFI